MSYYKSELKKFLADKTLKADRVLSVGCMHDDREYFKSVDIKEYKTVDISDEYKPDYKYDFNEEFESDVNCGDEFDLQRKSFDCILAFELMEYIWNPFTCLVNFNYLLEVGGELWLSVPFCYPTHAPEGMDYLRYTEFGIKKLLQEAGFEIKEFAYRNWEDNYWWSQAVIADRMKPLKGYKHHNATGFIIRAVKK